MVNRLDPTKRYRNFCLLLYAETESYDTQQVLYDIVMYDHVHHWYYILHDKDSIEQEDKDIFPSIDESSDSQYKKSHYHVVLRLNNACTISALAKVLKIPIRFVQPCSDWKSAIRYLVHRDDPDKYQYSRDLVSYSDPKEIFDSYFPKYKPSEGEVVSRFMELIRRGALMGELIQYAIDSDCWGYFRLNYRIIKDYLCNSYFKEQ